MNNLAGGKIRFFPRHRIQHFLLCLLVMISAVAFYGAGISYAAADADDNTDFGNITPAKGHVEATLEDILKSKNIAAMNKWAVADGEFLCIVTEGRNYFSGRWLPDRKFLFYEKTGDRFILKYEYETMDRFLAFYPLMHPEGRLLTIWDGGDTYHVVIFVAAGKELKVVLARGSKALPEIVDIDNDGGPDILLWGRAYEAGTGAEGKNRSASDKSRGYKWRSASLYRWNGDTYVLVQQTDWLNRLNAVAQKPQ